MNIITEKFRNTELNDAIWLDQMYTIDEKLVGDIADILGCSSCTVSRALTKHGIPRRNYRTEAEKANMSGARPCMCGENNPMFGGTHTPEARKKISSMMSKDIDKWIEVEQSKHRLCACGCGQEIVIQRWHFSRGIPQCINGHFSDDTRKKLSEKSKNHTYNRGRHLSEEHKRKLSIAFSGKNNPQWRGGVSYDPYCFKFTDRLKEEVRDRYNRLCVLCGKTEKENCRKLDVHHVDFNKNQGCDGVDWKLLPLCQSCHGQITRNEDAFQSMIESQLFDRLSTGMVI